MKRISSINAKMDLTKLFYKFINGTMKQQEAVSRIKDGGHVYKEDKDICEIMNTEIPSSFH